MSVGGHKGVVWTALVIAACLTTACGGPRPAGDTATTPHNRKRPIDTELLHHRTPRPPDVPEQFDYVGGAGPDACMGEVGPPRIDVIQESFPGQVSNDTATLSGVTYGQPVDICFDDFPAGRLAVRVGGPAGWSMSGYLAVPGNSDESAVSDGVDWVPEIDADWPLGAYRIHATVGTTQATSTFRVVAPQEPGLRVLGPSTDPGHNEIVAGSAATVFLVGFMRHPDVRLMVYRSSDGFGAKASFVGTQIVSVPASGNAVLHLATNRGDLDQTFVLRVPVSGRTLTAAFTVIPRHVARAVVGRLPN